MVSACVIPVVSMRMPVRREGGEPIAPRVTPGSAC